ncbi:putative AIG1 family-like protein [Homarus americanus]|uniref:Putative AIG1 family-like protein n=1 Tax=Homarus americanus TaxID=6706 RepID=A0A8J5MTH0_HOMAM|nr:putative AIG1 family-like protein [Homarus americanus]
MRIPKREEVFVFDYEVTPGWTYNGILKKFSPCEQMNNIRTQLCPPRFDFEIRKKGELDYYARECIKRCKKPSSVCDKLMLEEAEGSTGLEKHLVEDTQGCDQGAQLKEESNNLYVDAKRGLVTGSSKTSENQALLKRGLLNVIPDLRGEFATDVKDKDINLGKTSKENDENMGSNKSYQNCKKNEEGNTSKFPSSCAEPSGVGYLKPVKEACDGCGMKRKYYGVLSEKKPKTIILLGASGSGKTTLVNFVANYFSGVKSADGEVVHVVGNSNDVRSRTTSITAYTFCSGANDTPFTIIDTPGLNDSSGAEVRDHIQSLKTFLANAASQNLEVHVIGFVAQAHLVRLTSSERLVMDYVSTLFGQDITEHFVTFVTFSDYQEIPPVVEAMKNYGVKCNLFLKFNNSAISNNKTDEVDDLDRVYWKIGCKSWKKVVKSLENLPALSVNAMKTVQNEMYATTVIETAERNLRAELKAYITYSKGLEHQDKEVICTGIKTLRKYMLKKRKWSLDGLTANPQTSSTQLIILGADKCLTEDKASTPAKTIVKEECQLQNTRTDAEESRGQIRYLNETTFNSEDCSRSSGWKHQVQVELPVDTQLPQSNNTCQASSHHSNVVQDLNLQSNAITHSYSDVGHITYSSSKVTPSKSLLKPVSRSASNLQNQTQCNPLLNSDGESGIKAVQLSDSQTVADKFTEDCKAAFGNKLGEIHMLCNKMASDVAKHRLSTGSEKQCVSVKNINSKTNPCASVTNFAKPSEVSGKWSQVTQTHSSPNTPGLKNSSGADVNDYVQSLKTFITNAASQSLDIHAIGFVAQAHQVHLTSSELFIIDYVSKLYGQGVINHFIPFITCADNQKTPLVIEAMKNYGVKSKFFFKFNNFVLSRTSTQEIDDMDRIFWKTGNKNWRKCKQYLLELPALSVNTFKAIQSEVYATTVMDSAVRDLKSELKKFLNSCQDFKHMTKEAFKICENVWEFAAVVHHLKCTQESDTSDVKSILITCTDEMCKENAFPSKDCVKLLSLAPSKSLLGAGIGAIRSLGPLYEQFLLVKFIFLALDFIDSRKQNS